MYHFAWADHAKGKVGIQLKCIPEKRDATDMYPGKLYTYLVDKDLIQEVLLCFSTHDIRFIYKVLPEYSR